MVEIYVYVLDTLADWELGYVTSELNSGRFFRKDAPQIAMKTVGASKEPVRTMGGLTIVPDVQIDDMVVTGDSVLLLPGANTWNDPQNQAILHKADEFLSTGAIVGAICGATAALAECGGLHRVRPAPRRPCDAGARSALCRHRRQSRGAVPLGGGRMAGGP